MTSTSRSSRQKIYREYLAFLDGAAATRVLLVFGLALIAGEVAARIVNPRYERTAVSSLHGIRTIFQQALEDERPKILAFGDSTLVGGGIYAHEQTVIGRLSRAVPDRPVYNLAVPSGDTTTTVLLLDALRQERIANVDQVIIEVIPQKFITIVPQSAPPPAPPGQGAWEELRQFIPAVEPAVWNLTVPPLSGTARQEARVQWELGRISMLYRHRDYFRTEIVGNYPSFWLGGKMLPRSVLARLDPSKAQATNRLAARTDDFAYNPAEAPPAPGLEARFEPGIQDDFLIKAIRLAGQISSKPPLILSFPMHYEYEKLSATERTAYLRALDDYEKYLQKTAAATRSTLLLLPSREFQNPAYWTITPAHFNARGAARIWETVRPRWCRLHDCAS